MSNYGHYADHYQQQQPTPPNGAQQYLQGSGYPPNTSYDNTSASFYQQTSQTSFQPRQYTSSGRSGSLGGSNSTSPYLNPPTTTQQQQSAQKKEKVKLYDSRKEREYYENLAELYSTIITVERLEKAYVRDSIPAEAYETACLQLIAKFKTLKNMLENSIQSIEHFMEEYGIDCPAAKNRLLKIGVPATVEHGKGMSGSSKIIAETVQHFITAMDNLKLDFKSVDQIHPLINDLVDSLNKVPMKDFQQKQNLKSWLVKLNNMKASDDLSDTDVRQLLFELDSAYNTFHKLLSE